MSTRPSKKRRLTPPQSGDEDASSRSEKKIQKQFFKNAASWDLEQDYETKARKGKKKEKESSRLPIRLPDGRLQQVAAPAGDLRSVESDEDWLEDDGGDVSDHEPQERALPEKPDIPEPQQILEAKEELAKLASALNENPEESVGNFKAIAKIGESRIPAIQKLTLATQLAVYKDVIPGYRIRPISEDGPGEKLSKEVRTLRAYERSLVSGYQAYVNNLAKYAKTGKQQEKSAKAARGQSISSIAITCACTLLTSVPHFNFRSDLIKILVGKLSTRRVDDDFNKCLQALETLFHEDEEGRPAMEAVSLLSKMMRAREYEVDESVVNLFLHLRLLSEFAGKASKDTVEHADGAGKKVSNKAAKREFRTKRKRKELKEHKALQKDLAQADAVVGHEERDRMQSETLKLVFATYFRILKLRQPHLMGAVLEGLAKYAHLINQDFFGDLLEALKDLIRHSDAAAEGGEAVEGAAAADDEEDGDAPVRNPSREALLCTVTAFALLAGQDAHNARSDLHLDLSFFTTHLYQTLLPLSLNPDLELGAKSLRLPDPNAPGTPHPSTATTTSAGNKVNLQTTTVLLIRCLTAALLPAWNARSVPPLRLASFTKQLMTASLQVPERSAQALLALLADVGGQHSRKVAALWDTEERRGDGAFNPLSASVEGANPFAATVWEGEILRRHYCPKVREGVRLVERSMLQK
ncbi:hypothetical protein DL764_001241 [Monosporascus ibericus]|uniref:Nucleolar complex-associated protein 3 n=1 Tax=Monosporascus ibericus TaxID=155417 RepID=A0A4Q4TQG9_9PEZI|nr:hypothetical protein DL764_001241 [Monosporascus ibericus]